jgi:hypothetical protein
VQHGRDGLPILEGFLGRSAINLMSTVVLGSVPMLRFHVDQAAYFCGSALKLSWQLCEQK